MAGLPMPGGWTLSPVWLPMCGQSWAAAAAAFLGMWVAMMTAMMLPSLAPVLLHYRRAVGRSGAARPGWLTALVGLGYFWVWALIGLAVFPLGTALAAATLRQPALAEAEPVAAALVVLLAGLLQFTQWKTRHLARCRATPGPDRRLLATAAAAWGHGWHLGRHCGLSCAGPTAVLLVVGAMDLCTMALVTAAVTAERLAPDGRRAADTVGAAIVALGLFLLMRAAG